MTNRFNRYSEENRDFRRYQYLYKHKKSRIFVVRKFGMIHVYTEGVLFYSFINLIVFDVPVKCKKYKPFDQSLTDKVVVGFVKIADVKVLPRTF